MSHPLPISSLLDGPRGRRMLVEFAIESEGRFESGADSFGAAVDLAAFHLDPGRGSSAIMFGPGSVSVDHAAITPDDVARRLAQVELADVDAQILRSALGRSVDSAMYWQEPDGTDVLAAAPVMRVALARVLDHIASSAAIDWWFSAVELASQCSVNWVGQPEGIETSCTEILLTEHQRVVAEEVRAQRERPVDPRANWSGIWWSRPAGELRSSTRTFFDESPVRLWCVEDSLGWESAEVLQLDIPAAANVFEIDTAQAWADLCRRFPISVTAQFRQDWYRATGSTAEWVIPDWVQVAKHYDAVHLQVGAYLAAASTAIPVGGDSATVIAGWDPDVTYWFIDSIGYRDGPNLWERKEFGETSGWFPAGS